MGDVEEYIKNQKKHAGIYKQVFTENSPDKMAGNYNQRSYGSVLDKNH
jgi:hypothetical protein